MASPSESGVNWAPTLRPTRAQFERPFCDYVREVFKKHPEWACFKVIPPKGWAPRRRAIEWDDIRIATPIKQHVFGKSGSYMCILEEQRGMSAADFKRLAESPGHAPPTASGRRASDGADGLHERAFWSAVTCNPPLYGADTPLSLFDRRLDYGWNLRDLNCLLKEYDVPDIPGVTSPMAYFGMWKSFFGWHKEDIDLYSVNYNHCGASKIWYCVSPRDSRRFDSMARALYPEAHAACPAFVRHKDVLVSPRILRQYNVPFVQARQEAGEFIILNAAAYHSGFNLGWNVAEAVNFALPEWLAVGRDAVNCECEALADSVQLDMGIFFPELREDSSSEEEDSSDDGEDDDEEGSEAGSEEEEGGSGSDEEASSSSGGEEEEGGAKGRWRGGAGKPKGGPGRRTAALADLQAGRKRGRPADSEDSRHAENTPANKKARRAVRTPTAPEVRPSAKPGGAPRGATHAAWGAVAEGRPVALAARGAGGGEPRFEIVHRLARPATKPGAVWVGLLREGPDGLYRPTAIARQVALGSQQPRLVHVRAEWVGEPPAGGAADRGSRRRAGGWKLTTLAKRILMGV